MARRPDRATSDAGRTRNGGPDRGPADGPGPMLTDPFRAPPVSGSPARARPALPRPARRSPGGPSPVKEVLVASGSRGPGGGPGGGQGDRGDRGGGPPGPPPARSRKRKILKWTSLVTTIVLVAASLAAYVA